MYKGTELYKLFAKQEKKVTCMPPGEQRVLPRAGQLQCTGDGSEPKAAVLSIPGASEGRHEAGSDTKEKEFKVLIAPRAMDETYYTNEGPGPKWCTPCKKEKQTDIEKPTLSTCRQCREERQGGYRRERLDAAPELGALHRSARLVHRSAVQGAKGAGGGASLQSNLMAVAAME